MTFTHYLKAQLNDFVDSYKNYFWKTIGTTIAFTVVCFVTMSFLLWFSNFSNTGKGQLSLLSYFFVRYSGLGVYCLVDLSKSIFLFIVSIFSVALARLIAIQDKETKFNSIIKQIQVKDILYLTGVLILSSALDYVMVWLTDISQKQIPNTQLYNWVFSILYMLRIYVPLMLFSLFIYKLTAGKMPRLNLKKISFLFISLWLFNEFSYELTLFIRGRLFKLILIPFNQNNQYLIESILGIPIIAFLFMGYYSAMANSLELAEKAD